VNQVERLCATHLLVNPFPVRDGELVVGGVGLRRLAARVGRTPFYAYDRAQLTQVLS